jgi:2-polyprenyl-6-methoxyphenol hydroxylase-like FAD-dependent oxidoreductase
VRVDVCIVGSGIVGLHNALQYARRGFTVAIVDELTERSMSAYKVGESLLGYTNAFLRTVGDLDEEIGRSFPKHGVWFAYGMEGKEEFGEGIFEWGFQSALPQRWREGLEDPRFVRVMFEDAQIVRPEIESVLRNRLRDFNTITVINTGHVRDVNLGVEGDHTIYWRSRNGNAAGTVTARWLVDCSGRARLLVKRFGHTVALNDGFSTSSVWGQFSGCTDDIFDERWQYTFPEGERTRRDLDTVHLWGDGYWIWLIRLSNDRISVGVSFHRGRAPADGNLRDVFWEIVRRYPLLDFLAKENLLDFAAYRDVQHITDTYVSPRRYAIVGDAASIIDAYYSQGISLALVTSWHVSNIAERDMRDGVLDNAYIEHVNKATLADWRIMRGMVKGKYGPAMADSRFFILDHLLDYLVIAAALPGRYRIARWLSRTGGDSRGESPELARLRGKLSHQLFLSQAMPWDRMRPTTVAALLQRCRDGVERRALWRLDNGVQLRPMKGVMRPHAALPAVWRLPYIGLMRRPALTPRAIREPAFMRPKLTTKLPAVLASIGPIMVILVGYALAVDIVDTVARRAAFQVARWFGRRTLNGAHQSLGGGLAAVQRRDTVRPRID